MLILEVVIFGLAWWLGLYLLARANGQAVLRYSGIGLLAYGLALCSDMLWQVAPASLAPILRWQVPLLFAPVLCWMATLWHLRPRLIEAREKQKPVRQARGLILAATIFFVMGIGLILFPLDWLPRSWLLLGVGGDLLMLGYAVGMLDAFDQGEAFKPDFIRSFLVSISGALLFSVPIGLVMWLSTGATFAMLLLLLVTVATSLLIEVFADEIQRWYDRLIFGRNNPLIQERANLRAITQAIPRTAPPEIEWDDETFAKLTRRALSNLGNPPKLATSPLLTLPLIDSRLTHHLLDDNTLNRSAELKTILTESICKLKPNNDEPHGTTEAWRFFNALYYPYVKGLKPYGVRLQDGLDSAEKSAQEWFIREVPQRTLYNWQNAAAKLIAQDLQEQISNQ